MKHYLTFFYGLVLLLLSSQAYAQCPPGPVVMTSQQDINDFAANYPTCTAVDYLEISGNSVTDLSPLGNLTSIASNLYIHDTPLTSLTGLNNLTSLGQDLRLEANLSLTSLSGLENLTSVAGAVTLGHNYQLTSISALSNITSLGIIHLEENDILTSLSGLEGLVFVGHSIDIYGNDLLNDITALQNINPIPALSGMGLHIEFNSNLMVCYLPNICDYLANPPGTHPRMITGNAGTVWMKRLYYRLAPWEFMT